MTGGVAMVLWISGQWAASFLNVRLAASLGVTSITNGEFTSMDIRLLLNSNPRAIMFHIGVATQHPPLPDNGELSDLGINFIKLCLTIDALRRPMADELLNHPWMQELIETLRSYEEEELSTNPPADIPSEQNFKGATVARQAAILEEKEVEAIKAPSPQSVSPGSDTDSPAFSPEDTPDNTAPVVTFDEVFEAESGQSREG